MKQWRMDHPKGLWAIVKPFLAEVSVNDGPLVTRIIGYEYTVYHRDGSIANLEDYALRDTPRAARMGAKLELRIAAEGWKTKREFDKQLKWVESDFEVHTSESTK